MAELDGGRAAVSLFLCRRGDDLLLINVAMVETITRTCVAKTLAISKAAAFVVVREPSIYE
jgi:hypothetical protein